MSPVLLPCGHAMCKPCREVLVKKRLRTTCPRCREASSRPGQDLFERAMIALSRVETRIARGECPSWAELDPSSETDLSQVRLRVSCLCAPKNYVVRSYVERRAKTGLLSMFT